MIRPIFPLLVALACKLLPLSAAQAQDETAPSPPLDLSAALTVDIVSLTSGTGDANPRVLTNLDLTAEADLDQVFGWQGTRAFVYVLDNRGARPNDRAGTLQGINNIEVPSAGTRLFEAWVEHATQSGASVLAGLYDLNSEFYASDTAGLLTGPPFGIGSELAGTGPNGPSIFPSSALAVRVKVPVGARGRIMAAALNADARTLGDNGGVDVSFRNGLLLIGEGGLVEGPVRASLGGWAYTRRQETVVTPPPGSPPARRAAQGAYALVEADLAGNWHWFGRAGASSGAVSPFSGGWQTGFLLSPALSSRPDSGLSLGMHRAWINRAYRAEIRAAGDTPARVEDAYALTYADQIMPQLGVQGEVQWVRRPGAIASARGLLVTTLRLTLTL